MTNRVFKAVLIQVSEQRTAISLQTTEEDAKQRSALQFIFPAGADVPKVEVGKLYNVDLTEKKSNSSRIV